MWTDYVTFSELGIAFTGFGCHASPKVSPVDAVAMLTSDTWGASTAPPPPPPPRCYQWRALRMQR